MNEEENFMIKIVIMKVTKKNMKRFKQN